MGLYVPLIFVQMKKINKPEGDEVREGLAKPQDARLAH